MAIPPPPPPKDMAPAPCRGKGTRESCERGRRLRGSRWDGKPDTACERDAPHGGRKGGRLAALQAVQRQQRALPAALFAVDGEYAKNNATV